MAYIENSKTYTGKELETIFFRPMLSGENAEQLGIRILYNMPTPMAVQLWDGNPGLLQRYTTAGWEGENYTAHTEKEVSLERVKAEMSFSAANYFSTIYEHLVNSAEVNMDDLSGTELEQAETEIFRRSIAEALRATMWIGDPNGPDDLELKTFPGLLTQINNMAAEGEIAYTYFMEEDLESPDSVIDFFEKCWGNASERLKDLKREGELVLFVTSDIYHLYERYLDSKGADVAYSEMIAGRPSLAYHGIPVVDMHVGSYLPNTFLPQSLILLTDRRNLVLAVNTADYPGTEVRMWYNPDLMENRQRAIFMAGCTVLDETLLSYCILNK